MDDNTEPPHGIDGVAETPVTPCDHEHLIR